MILAENNVVFPNSDSKITINTYKIRLGQKLRMLPYGEIYDLSKDGPFEYDIKDKENQTIQDQKNKHIQLALFPI